MHDCRLWRLSLSGFNVPLRPAIYTSLKASPEARSRGEVLHLTPTDKGWHQIGTGWHQTDLDESAAMSGPCTDGWSTSLRPALSEGYCCSDPLSPKADSPNIFW